MLYFSCRILYELKVSVEQILFKVDESNWLVTCEKLKKEYASFHTERLRIVSRWAIPGCESN